MTTCHPMRLTPPRSGVLHLITDPRPRGAQVFAHELHRELRARGWNSRIAALAPQDDGTPPGGSAATAPLSGPAEAAPASVRDVAVLGPTRMHPRTLRALRRATAGAGVVVAHGSTTLPACTLALAFRRTPFVYVNIGDPRHWAARPDQRLRVGAMLHRAAMTASVSPTGRDLLVAHYRLPAGKVRAIPNGRRPEAYPRVDAASRAAARKELGIPDDAVVIAVVGALSREKRVGLAIEGFARHLVGITGAAATADPPDLRQRELPDAAPLLLVAGDGPERAELAALADRRAPGRVRFLGTVGDAAPVYRAADALLLTSASEGVPGVLVEAGLSGIPAAATDVGFVRDVVLDGRTGALAASGDPGAVAAAIGRAVAHRDAWGAAAYEHCTKAFAMEAVVGAWEDLLQSVMAEAPASS